MIDVERIPAAEEIERIDALIEREKEAHRGAAGYAIVANTPRSADDKSAERAGERAGEAQGA